MIKQKILFYCQYVYGIGHLVRSLQLANGLAEFFDVYFISGGEAINGFEINSKINFIQLEAVYKEENRNSLTCVNEDFSLEECFKLRAEKINSALHSIVPDLIITEHFPFGFLFENESLQLLNDAKEINKKVKVVCSVRDIIEKIKGGKSDIKTNQILNKYYDLLLIHGDERLISIDQSFTLSKEIKIESNYTGYIVDTKLKGEHKTEPNILVSVAGGRLGKELLSAVSEAFGLIKSYIPHNLLLFTGAFDSLNKLKGENERVQFFEFHRDTFLKKLSSCEVSISLGGYNTIIESIVCQKKVLVYNREFLGENEEQNIRISKFKDLGLLNLFEAKDLNKYSLSKLIMEMIEKPGLSKNKEINSSGVSNSINHIKRLLDVY